ncbi:response regulator transcription factor [Paraburkholderia sp. BCC1886]|uniref:response regulator transcription factor n=1 Tax=Paraburkholderia sp. BCC1886 TaxID=2562670 RepID=UPI001182B27E|nr:response regulator [Paraburkholderia sp. BCC1886]
MSFVCIVDDDASMRSSLSNLLKSLGYAARTFASGEEFLASTVLDDALCVLLDLRLQGMQGPDVQSQMVEKQCHIPVVFMSAHGDDETVRRAMQCGAVAFLRKPFTEDVLVESITLAIARHGDAK